LIEKVYVRGRAFPTYANLHVIKAQREVEDLSQLLSQRLQSHSEINYVATEPRAKKDKQEEATYATGKRHKKKPISGEYRDKTHLVIMKIALGEAGSAQSRNEPLQGLL
jgi:uncharacterized protein YoaH (UPF0181 family)